MRYWLTREILKFICRISGQQCSGKQKHGFAIEWCQQKALHDGPCTAYDGTAFARPL